MSTEGCDFELTREQLKVVKYSGSCFVDACPGAGKTRTVVALFLDVAKTLGPRHGVAVCSYTNAAADEVRARCLALDRPGLCDYPNFLGTVDGFIGRYLVVPFGIPGLAGVRPRIVESWESIGCRVLVPVETNNGTRRIPFSLDAFPLGSDGKVVFAPSRLPRKYRRAFKAVGQDVLDSAHVVRERAWSNGYLSCDDCRAITLRRLRDRKWSGPVLSALAARFQMVIIDEAQDCNPLDLEIVQRVRAAGIRTVVVADPNQAIFGFRGADPAALTSCIASLRRFPLTRNYRSTKIICQVASSLRRESVVDVAAAKHADEQIPTLILPYDGELGAELGKTFSSEITRQGIAPRDSVVLAHEFAVALQAVGRPPPPDDEPRSMLSRLADSVARFKGGADPRTMVRALDVVQRVLLSRLSVGAKPITPEHAAEDSGISARWLRIEALRLMGQLQQLPMTPGEEETWIESAAEILAKARPPGGTPFKRTFQQVAPRAAKFRLPCVSASEIEIPAATVHAVKGREYDSVLLVLPRDDRTDDVLMSWEDRTDNEARAVLYVGATRARRLLAIGVPAVFRPKVEALVSRNGATYRVVPVRGEPIRRSARASNSSQMGLRFT